ncbi:hypothetical protein FGIG_01023 [Fasciola gigantica]|uniref:Uncharacterized protein n=1 Tax=Fasciola gigantica TaxID=46835 RepID=A0A504X0D1_FASGI|nr:hypothetical protein FGIG_01023 [Fasciola gigantica]
MTTDGRSYTPVEEISFARHRNHSYSCVFTWPIRARGLLVVPLIPVVKHEIPTQDIQLYGTVDKRDVYQYGELYKYLTTGKIPARLNRVFIYLNQSLVLVVEWTLRSYMDDSD